MRAHILRIGILLCTLLLLGTLGSNQTDLAGAVDDTQAEAPGKGMFLVAARGIADPRFQHSVILVVRHDPDGSMGLIINRPTSVPLSQAVADLKGVERARHTLFFGGPVQMNIMMFLIRSRAPVKNADQVSDEVYVSGSRSTLEHMLGDSKGENELRVFVGYAGWAPGQLDAELAQGDWHLVPADTKAIFDQDPDKLWQQLIDREEPDGLIVRHTPVALPG